MHFPQRGVLVDDGGRRPLLKYPTNMKLYGT